MKKKKGRHLLTAGVRAEEGKSVVASSRNTPAPPKTAPRERKGGTFQKGK